ncbi:similar to Saccharomyces cerevisiae YLR256W HAP1 Zinc finger transcription factor involved in the complex regulation of gene expression in response to levels of heme and oxygen [Maudiozyma saulgeensis]|uniref:Similar to Saccharomyces cerevisiae YLR256W HAP1 Zinc finger transcription factor involved in the complex regulation of gene expression in response to levels of heme and oxygen n=1 Tax=Maudiozyma saulgeensis TaxID=1789683 RepID=A0A1X7R8M4_9SACH|nr:similar to Saccharomyces cerevisiae YLR256W HAP1 Zinc finger transcription factor involved in the complex regulation of gene expression in response to levels of heme and oxygen [Kazachstania saulgeensis]
MNTQPSIALPADTFSPGVQQMMRPAMQNNNNSNNNNMTSNNMNMNMNNMNNMNMAMNNNNNISTNITNVGTPNSTTSVSAAVSASVSPSNNTPTSSSSNKDKEKKSKRKRNRIPLSCTICRKRKVKCDKIRPHCNQCTKTGVAHLCHYMEQSWAEEAEKELSKEAELKNLRDRVKYLEKALSKIHSSNSNSNTVANTPDNNNMNINSPVPSIGNSNSNNSNGNNSMLVMNDSSTSSNASGGADRQTQSNSDDLGSLVSTTNHPSTANPRDKYDNDELDLTKQFDMLHIKNNGTIHLGATHWLAIMKGDPYLKLLWGHIFNIRERVNDWYSQRMVGNSGGATNGKRPPHQSKSFQNLQSASSGKCPIDYKSLVGTAQAKAMGIKTDTPPPPNSASSSTPVAPHPLPAGSSGDISKCPVAHRFVDVRPAVKKEPQSSPMTGMASVGSSMSIAPHPLPVGSNGDISKCPVAHGFPMEANETAEDSERNENDMSNQHMKRTESDNKTNTRTAPVSATNPLPSFQKLTSKCPVPHETEPSLMAKATEQMTYEQIITKVVSMLPPRHIILTFIDKFFKHIYPIIPIIDEQNFKNHLVQILHETPDKKLELHMAKSSDYCNLGIMIIILRLTWLSLPANRCEINLGNTELTNSYLASHLNINTNSNNKEDNQLMKHETPMELLNLVKDNLIKFDKISSISNNNINLTTIQFAIMYKIYMMNSPTEGFANKRNNNSFHSISDPNSHDSELNQILLSSIIQMAFSCGLHRDPDNFPQLNVVSTYGQSAAGTTMNVGNSNQRNNSNSNGASGTSEGNSSAKENQITTERFKHTWRKIWFYIVHLDVQQSLTLGTPRLLRNLKDFSDTKLPSASKIDYVRDIKELIIIKNFSLFWQIDLVIIAVLNNILNVFLAKNVRKFELDELIQSLSNLTYAKKSIGDVLNDLINNGLLTTSEGSINFQDYTDESYGLPSLEEIISSTATPIGNSSVSSPMSAMNTPGSTTGASPASSVSGKKHLGTPSEKKFELPHESTTKALFFTKHLTLRMLLYLLNYILFTHYEPMGSQDSGTIALTKNYAQQTLNFATDGYRNCLIFFNNVKRDKILHNHSTIFDYVNILLTPHCLDIGHRALQFLVCLTLRSKCGPIGGMKENIFSNNSSGGEDSDNDSHSSDSSSNYGSTRDPLELSSNMINNIVLDSVADFQLANILIARMKLFQKLTKQIAVQYPYAARTYRSTGFFITLLSGHKKGGFNLTTWKHPKISGFFKNVPSLIMSGNTDQLKRCPVYQDALGFVGPRVPSTSSNTQLPPIRSSYKPITYTNSNIRKLEQQAEKDASEKRRKLNNTVVTPALNPGKTLSSGISSTGMTLDGTKVQKVPQTMMTGQQSYNGNGTTSYPSAINSPAPAMNMQLNAASPAAVPLPSVSNFFQDSNNNVASRNNLAVNNANLMNSTLTPNSDDFFVQNSNFGDLFDPNSVMAAINEFNPMSEMGAPNTNNIDNFAQGGLNGNMSMGSMASVMNMQGNGMNTGATGMPNMGNNGNYANNMNNANPVTYDNMSGFAGPAMMNMGNVGNVMDGTFVPKIEDGFTELQDFTIWD